MPFSSLSETQRQLLLSFLTNNVNFMVVGGYAVRFHGYLREARDLDLLVNPDSVNASMVTRCLLSFGAERMDETEQFLKNDWKKVDWRDVDILTTIHGDSFSNLDVRSASCEFMQQTLKVISKADLIIERRLSLKDDQQSERHKKIKKDLEYLEI